MKIAFVPIDNRPVCYSLPKMIAKINKSIEILLPEKDFLGDLKKVSNPDKILKWLENLENIDAIVLSLDTIAYGGLIPSRRSNQTFEQVKNRIEHLKEILQSKNTKIYAFSSIMRISNNNINEEEKEYWNLWGKKIFEYSYQSHKTGKLIESDIPKEILEDYIQTRKRNFEINKIYLNWQKEKFFDTLIFSKDDCAEFGFNVQEAEELEGLGAFVKTGADEIPLSLISRTLDYELKIAPIFLEPEYKDLISNYEDVSIKNSVLGQIELAGCKVSTQEDADILLYVNNFIDNQGEIVMKIPTKPYNKKWEKPYKPYMVADIRFANGADNVFVDEFLKHDFDNNFYGYSAWNTSANSLGSLICSAKMKWLAEKFSSVNENEFIKLQITRFLDDWGYQANVRQMLEKPDTYQCKNLMENFEKIIFDKFNTIGYNVNYIFPWDRLFEVEIEFN